MGAPVLVHSRNVLAQQIGTINVGAQRGRDAFNVNSLQLIKPAPTQQNKVHSVQAQHRADNGIRNSPLHYLADLWPPHCGLRQSQHRVRQHIGLRPNVATNSSQSCRPLRP